MSVFSQSFVVKASFVGNSTLFKVLNFSQKYSGNVEFFFSIFIILRLSKLIPLLHIFCFNLFGMYFMWFHLLFLIWLKLLREAYIIKEAFCIILLVFPNRFHTIFAAIYTERVIQFSKALWRNFLVDSESSLKNGITLFFDYLFITKNLIFKIRINNFFISFCVLGV